jgi:hypothetical protein
MNVRLEVDRFCGLLAANSEVPGSIPDGTKFLSSNGSGTGSTQPHEHK